VIALYQVIEKIKILSGSLEFFKVEGFLSNEKIKPLKACRVLELDSKFSENDSNDEARKDEDDGLLPHSEDGLHPPVVRVAHLEFASCFGDMIGNGGGGLAVAVVHVHALSLREDRVQNILEPLKNSPLVCCATNRVRLLTNKASACQAT